jgi:protein-disulfide isomerase
MDKRVKAGSIIVLFFIVILIGFFVYHLVKASSKNSASISLQEKDLDIVYGSDKAALTVFMFSSYECKFCTNFLTESLPLLKKEYIETNKVKLIIKLVDISNNSYIINSLKLAVSINECGNFEPIDKLLQSEPSVVYSDEFMQLTEDFIEQDQHIEEYMLSGIAESYIITNYKDFKALALTGTPTFIINNKIYKGYKDYESFKNKIEKELNSAW